MTIELNLEYVLEIFLIDSKGNAKSGLSVSYSIENSDSDIVVDSGSLTDLGNGVYKALYTFASIGQFRIIYTTPDNYEDKIETIFVVPQHALEETLKRVLGLSQENYRIFDLEYDDHNNLTSALIKIYNTKEDTDNDTNSQEEYIMTATYNNNLMASYKFVRTAS